MFTTFLVARRTDADNESAAYWLQGAIDNNAGSVALVGTVNQTAIEDTVAWNATAVALGGRLVLRVTGEAAKTIRWNAVTNIVQVSG
jgi:Na+-translocating ferredoxin:NAD+ oxidoreductase RnfE subunit